LGKHWGQYCTRNNECDSGCCDWEKVVPGYGNGMCSDKGDCWWLASSSNETPSIFSALKAESTGATCPNQLEFGGPMRYKITVGKAPIRKRGNNLELDRFGDGTVFFTAAKGDGIAIWTNEDGKAKYVNEGLTFTESRSDAVTFNVSTSQYGKKLSIGKKVLIKHPENDNGLQMREDEEQTAMVTFTKWSPPTWKEDLGSKRDRVMIEMLEKVCGQNSTCAEVVAGYLQPGNVEDFTSCSE
jgi:hypothetical protein